MPEIKDDNPLQELLDQMISSLEPIEARSDAIYQFLKAKGLVTDKDFAPFLEQGANASNVRWRAFRVRAESLIAGAMKTLEKESNTERPAEKAQATESQEPETSKAEDRKNVTDEANKQAEKAFVPHTRADAETKKNEPSDSPTPEGSSEKKQATTSKQPAGGTEVQGKTADKTAERSGSSAKDQKQETQPTLAQTTKDAPRKDAA
jgi:hypothetical protein